MREILFRGKRVDNGEWVEGIPIQTHIGVFICFDENPHYCSQYGYMEIDKIVMVDETIVCQYTGLTDKNGRKIFEGDIVKYQFDNDDCPFPNKHTEKIIGKIFFSDFRASFSVTAGRNCSTSINNDLFKYVQNGNRVEVIGNIFDNPELIGGKEE